MKQAFKTTRVTFELLKFIHSLDRSIIPLYLIVSLLKAFEPFVMIIGNALIIDSLLTSHFQQAIIQTVVMLLTLFILGLILAYLAKQKETSSMTINRLCNAKICLKAISLDYATFEDKKNLEEFEAADYNVSRNGGFGWFILEISDLLNGCFSLLIALFFLAKLCLETSNNTSIFSFLVSRTGSFLTIGILIMILIILYAKFSHYTNQNKLKIHYEMVDVNQKLSYFGNRLCADANLAKEVRLYRLKDLIYAEWKKLSLTSFHFTKRQWSFDRIALLTSSFLNDIVLLLAYLFVVIKTYVGAISIGSFTQYVGAIQQFNQGLKKIIEALNLIVVSQSYLAFYLDFIKKENQLDTGSLPVEKRNDNEYEFAFHNVSYKYPGTDTYCLKNVSVKLNMKSHFAIVGRNGAGKTTFIKLLCRMYDVSEGMITLNGIDIRKYDYQEYLNLFAAVFQDFSLFSFPIDENVSCSFESDEERVKEVLTQAGIRERIAQMPNDIHTLLYHDMGDGVDVSGGEAQKIAIARVLYKDAPFVILDEPTAALDPISEFEVYSQFDEMVKNKTSIYISHRMSSCRFCDDILVFDQGSIVQRGNHDTLIQEEEKVYAKLWNAQAKYYNSYQQTASSSDAIYNP